MNNVPRTLLYGISAVSFTLAMSSTAFAQGMAMEKSGAMQAAGQITRKTLAENAKVAVIDSVSKPGETSPMQSRPMHVIHIMSGGTLERTYADGKKEVIAEKAGDTKIIDISQPYAVKNIGKTTIHTIIINVK
jgi:quercetin dioxygenase-like cupin family protein